MTRRIAAAILATVWATLIAAGFTAYFTTRSVMLANLDASIQVRAASLPEVAGAQGSKSAPTAYSGDRWIVHTRLGQMRGRPEGPRSNLAEPTILNARFSRLADGHLFRVLALQFPAADGEVAPVVVYSGTADDFDRVMKRLALALGALGIVGAGATVAVAAAVARTALRPLHGAAETIGAIDEANIGRRIDAAALPRELRPVAGRLNEMLTRLQHAFEERRRFLADASHELRTPVATLVTTAEIALRRPREAPELTDALRICLSEAKHMNRLVQALLRQVRGELPDPAATETFDLLLLIEESAVAAASQNTHHQVSIRRPSGAPLLIHTKPHRLRGILTNLISNAVEHNHAGGHVEVTCKVDGANLELSVADDGPGIAPEHLAHLFQPFYRVKPAQDDDHPHLGLGLFLVQSHAKALGGSCSVESELGRGTLFRVRLPAVIAVNPGAGSRSAGLGGVAQVVEMKLEGEPA